MSNEESVLKAQHLVIYIISQVTVVLRIAAYSRNDWRQIIHHSMSKTLTASRNSHMARLYVTDQLGTNTPIPAAAAVSHDR